MAYNVCIPLNIFHFWGGFAHEREEQLFQIFTSQSSLTHPTSWMATVDHLYPRAKQAIGETERKGHPEGFALISPAARMHQCWKLIGDEGKHKKIKISDCVPRLTFTEKMFLPGKKIKPSSFLNSTYTVLNKNQRLYQRKQTLWKMRFR